MAFLLLDSVTGSFVIRDNRTIEINLIKNVGLVTLLARWYFLSFFLYYWFKSDSTNK